MRLFTSVLCAFMCLVFLSGCSGVDIPYVDNPYRNFDPEGVLVNGYLGLHESETKLLEDKSFKKTETLYQKRVILFGKNCIFSYSKHGYIIKDSEYIYYPSVNLKEEIIEFTLEAYKELTSAFGAPKQIKVSKYRKEDEYLADIDEAVLRGLYDYLESHSSEPLFLAVKWEKDIRHIQLIVQMEKGIKTQFSSISIQ